MSINIETTDELLHYITYTLSKYENYETIVREIPSRDLKKLVFPNHCTSFELFDRIYHHDEQDNTIYVGEVVNRLQYYIGEVYDLDRVAREQGANSQTYRDLADTAPDKIVKVYGDDFWCIGNNDHVVLPSRLNFANEFGIAPDEPSMTK